MNNLISIIMPIYNSSKYLIESIGSVINQDYENWELICINDGSTDNSLEIIKNYEQKNKKIKVYSQRNLGPAQARKLGISESKGEYICYLDSDDVYSADYLYETLKQALLTDADVTMPILVSGWQSDGEYNMNNKHNLNFGDIILPRDAFLRTFPWTVHSLNLYKASHIKKYALTDISNVNNFDADEYLARFLLLFSNKVAVSKGTYYYRYNTDSITKKFSLRQFSSSKVNDLLFDLAINEGFNTDELAIVANQLFINTVALKHSYLSNFDSISKKDSNWIRNNFKSKAISSWMPYIKINTIDTFKFYVFLKTSNRFLIPIIKIRNHFKY